MSMEDKQLKALLSKGETFVVDLRGCQSLKVLRSLLHCLGTPRKLNVWFGKLKTVLLFMCEACLYSLASANKFSTKEV